MISYFVIKIRRQKSHKNNTLNVFINQICDDKLTQFYQDCAMAYTARATIAYLYFSRLPKLASLDYYIYSHLKNTVFKQSYNLKIANWKKCKRATTPDFQINNFWFYCAFIWKFCRRRYLTQSQFNINKSKLKNNLN